MKKLSVHSYTWKKSVYIVYLSCSAYVLSDMLFILFSTVFPGD